MAFYICNRNRLDWDGNPGAAVRRGERFEMKDNKRAAYLFACGYILEDTEEKPEPLETK